MTEENKEIIYKLAKEYYDNDNIHKAIETLKSIENEEGKTAVWNYRMGFFNFYDSNYEEALKYFFKVLKIEPTYKGVYTFLTWIYIELSENEANDEKNNYILSLEYIDKALKYAKLSFKIDRDEEIREDFLTIYQKSAWLCEKLNNYEMAIEYLNLSLEIENESEWTFSEMGHCLRILEKYDESLKYLHKALELGRRDTWIYSELGWTYYLKGENKIALDYMLKAKELSPLSKDEFLEKRISILLKEIKK